MSLPSWLENLPWGEMLASAIGGGGLLKIISAVWNREPRHVKSLGATIKTLSDQLDKSDARQERVEQRLDDAEQALEECKSHHENCREELRAVNAEIDRLMSGAPADYVRLERPVEPKTRTRRPKE